MRQFALPSLLLCLVLFTQACAYKPGVPLSSLDGSQSGVVYFTSANNYDFSRGEPLVPLTVDGNLRFPSTHNGAAFVLSHGAGGRTALNEDWAEFLRGHGFATFSINHFGPRNVLSTVPRQVRVTEQQMAMDIINATTLLASDPRIEADKIYHIGWSKGATAGLMAAIESTHINDENRQPLLAGYIGFYPYCGFVGEVFSSTKILLLHGKADDYTLLAACERLVELMRDAGSNVTLNAFDGAHHGFDNWGMQLISSRRSITVRDMSDKCTLVYSRDRHTHSVDGNFSIENSQARIDFLRACAVRGVHLGGSPRYKSTVEQMVLKFAKAS